MKNLNIHPDTQFVSFDLWLTLIKSNGVGFKQARNAYMGSLLAPNMPAESFDAVVRASDKLADKIAESRGNDVLFGERVAMVAEVVGAPEPSADLLGHLYEYQGALLQKNPPTLIDPKTPALLDDLKHDYGIGVISNTGYLHGDQMRGVLDAIGIGQKMDHMVFSNEVGYAKPDQRIFQALLNSAGVEAPHVTHIGDNPQADIVGAQAVGMHAIQIGPELTLQEIVRG